MSCVWPGMCAQGMEFRILFCVMRVRIALRGLMRLCRVQLARFAAREHLYRKIVPNLISVRREALCRWSALAAHFVWVGLRVRLRARLDRRVLFAATRLSCVLLGCCVRVKGLRRPLNDLRICSVLLVLMLRYYVATGSIAMQAQAALSHALRVTSAWQAMGISPLALGGASAAARRRFLFRVTPVSTASRGPSARPCALLGRFVGWGQRPIHPVLQVRTALWGRQFQFHVLRLHSVRPILLTF